MNGCLGSRLFEDYPEGLVLTANSRICDKCGTPTMWASARQKVKGRHWACIPGNTFWRSTDEHETRVLLDLIAAFPGATIDDLEHGANLMDVGYAGPGAGPCALCRGPIRRYGEGGLPLCKKCDLARINGGTS